MNIVLQNPDTGEGRSGGERCAMDYVVCLFAKSYGWFLSLWHVFVAADIELGKEAQGNSAIHGFSHDL